MHGTGARGAFVARELWANSLGMAYMQHARLLHTASGDHVQFSGSFARSLTLCSAYFEWANFFVDFDACGKLEKRICVQEPRHFC